MSKAVIVFSGFNQRAIISFLRTLEKNKIMYAIIAAGSEDSILQTEYAKKVISIRQKIKLDQCDLLNSLKKVKRAVKANKYLIAPSTEALNRYLLSHLGDLQIESDIIPLVNLELYEKISNKASFTKLCRDHGINLPKEFPEIDKAPLPLVAKPKKYESTNGTTLSPVLIFTEAEKKKFLESYCANEFYFQEFVQGPSYYLLYYFYRNGRVEKFSQVNLVQQPRGKSIIAARTSSIHQKEIFNIYESMFKDLGFYGLVMVEVKGNETRSPLMIEANPRFWGPSQLFVDAGVNLFEHLLNDFGFLERAPTSSQPIKTFDYFWYGGLIQTLRSKESLALHNYSLEELSQELSRWLSADIYNRKDTRKILLNEVFDEELF